MASDNPFAAPEEAHAPATEGELTIGGMAVATQNRRFCNFFIDSIIVRVMSFAAGMALAMSYLSGGRQMTAADEAQINLLSLPLGLLIVFGYFALSELVLRGATIGKLITGTRVVRADGSPPSFGQIVGRSLTRLIPFEPLSFLFGDKTTGWHDSLSGTRVVRKS